MVQVLALNNTWHRAVIQITSTGLLPWMEVRSVIIQLLLHLTVVHLVVQAPEAVAEVVQVAVLVNLRS